MVRHGLADLCVRRADWRDITDTPEIDIVSITAPNALHKEMSLAAIASREARLL